MYKSLQKRVLCLMLAAIMLLGMLPTSAMAVTDGENSVTPVVVPATDTDRPAATGYGSYSGSFTRVTLVEYDFSDHGATTAPSVSDNQWLNPAKTTSIDIASNDSTSALASLDAAAIAGVKHWLTANAMDYRNTATLSEIRSVFESNLQTGSWPVITDAAMADYVFGTDIMADIASGGEDVLLNNYRNGQAANTEFLTLLGLFDSKLGSASGQTAKLFFDANSGKSYRLIVEPGVVVTIDNEPWAMTMRDWGAWSLTYFENDKGTKGEYAVTKTAEDGSTTITVNDITADPNSDAAKAAGNAPLWYSWFDKFINLAGNLRLKSGHDQMATYVWDGMSEFKPENIKYSSGIWKSEKTFDEKADWKAMFSDGSVAYTGSDYFISHAFGFQNDRMSQHSGSMGEAFGNGVYAGYGMGMLAPYDFPENISFHTGLSIERNTSGNAGVEAGKFEVQLTGLKDSTGKALTGSYFYDLNGTKTALTVTNGTATVSFELGNRQTAAFPQNDVYLPAVPAGTQPYSYKIAQTNANVSTTTTVSVDGIAGTLDSANAISGTILAGSGSTVVFNDGMSKLFITKLSGDDAKDYVFNVTMAYTNAEGKSVPVTNGEIISYVDSAGASQTMVYNNGLQFTLKNKELVTIYAGDNYSMTVDEVGAGASTMVNNKAYTGPVTVNLTEAQTLVFASDTDKLANVVLDLNFNGTGSGDDGAKYNVGLYTPGDTIPADKLAVKMNGAALAVGDVTEIMSGKCSVCGAAYGITLEYNGLWTDMTDGDMISGSYKVPESGVITLYAHWTAKLNQGCACDSLATAMNANAQPVGRNAPSDGNTTLSDTSYMISTVYWNLHHSGGGITTSLVGKFKLEYWYRLDDCNITFDKDGESGEHSSEYSLVSVTVVIPPVAPENPAERIGWTFMGWSTYGGAAGGFRGGFDWPSRATYERLEYPYQIINYVNTWVNPFISTMSHHSETEKIHWPYKDGAVEDSDTKYLNGADGIIQMAIDQKPGIENTATFYAIWLSNAVSWSANGGAFTDYGEDSWDADGDNTNLDKSDPKHETVAVYPIEPRRDVNGPMYAWSVRRESQEKGSWMWTQKPVWNEANKTWAFVPDYSPVLIYSPARIEVTSTIPVIKHEPTRPGYLFTGWYYDRLCTIPMDMFDTGVSPSRTYYAGWKAEPVEITYYDTREGTSVLGTQTWLYGYPMRNEDMDAINIVDTSGQTFNGWTKADGTAVTAADLVNSDETYDAENATGIKGKGLNVSDLIDCGAVYTAARRTIAGSKETSTIGPVGIENTEGSWKLNLYADWTTEYRKFQANVDIDDYLNNDASRPQAITIALADSVTGREVENSDHTFVVTDGQSSYDYLYPGDGSDGCYLPITTADASVEKVTYNIYFKSYVDGDGTMYDIKDPQATSGSIEVLSGSDYDTTVSAIYNYAINNFAATGTARNRLMTGNIYMAHDIATTGEDIKFTIQWDDLSNNDGLRPGAVTLTLYANGVPVQGKPSHNSGTGTVSVSPGICDVSADGNTWTYTFKDYQKYENGTAINYTMSVSDVPNTYTRTYTTTGSSIGSDPTGVKLTHVPDTQSVPVNIRWDDELNRDGQRPDTIDVALYAYQWNGKTYRWEEALVATKTGLTGGSTAAIWATTFINQKVKNGGQDIIYVAKVTSDLNAHVPAGANPYSWVSSEREITISHNKSTTSVPVTIQWDDHGNNDTIRPKTVIVQLYADHVKVPGAEYSFVLSGDATAPTWTHTFENLPKYAVGSSGREVVYTIGVEESGKDTLYGTYTSMATGEEQILTRYIASYVNAAGETVTDINQSAKAWVTLKHDIDQGTTVVYASWHDDENQDSKRPASILVDLYKRVGSVETKMQTLTVSADATGTWKNKVTGLPLFENGQVVTYFVNVSDEYQAELAKSGYTVSIQGATVHLYYATETGTVTGQIHWDDNNNNDALRPATALATLYANGVRAKDASGVLIPEIALNADNNWLASWTDLPVYYSENKVSGKQIVYTIQVAAPTGYTVSYTPASTTLVTPTDIVITMSHGFDLIKVPVTVNWNDDSNTDGTRPASVKIQLKSNGVNLPGKIIEITGTGDTWTGEFTDMPSYLNGKPVEYTVVLADTLGKKYEAMTAGTILYLSKDALKASMSVAFEFNDLNNADGVRPTSLYVQLTANGVPLEGSDYEYTMNFSTDGNARVFNGLPVNSGNGTKVKYGAIVTLDEKFGSIDYTTEVSADRELSTTNTNKIVVKLSRTAATGIETGHIYWFDAGNQRGNRPETLSITVRNNAVSNSTDYLLDSKSGEVRNDKGVVVGDVAVIPWGNDNKASCWTYHINGLRQNSILDDGLSYEIRYWAMAKATGISTFYTVLDGEANGLDVNLTHVNYKDDIGSSTQDFSVTVDWLDNQNAWGYRPDTAGVDVQLLANGVVYKTQHLTKANVLAGNTNSWTVKFDNLPTYLEGAGVVYTANIADIDKYTENVKPSDVAHDTYATITMTQSIGFDFRLNWNDSDNDDAVRPAAVTLNIFGDGTKVGSITLAQNDAAKPGIWTGSAKDLAVWRTVGSGTAIAYTFQWDETTKQGLIDELYDTGKATLDSVPVETLLFYYLSTKTWGDAHDAGLNDLTGQYQFETTLTRNKATRDVSGEIVFVDDANRDGKRPASVAVQLMADGVAFGESVTVTGTENTWPVDWTGLDIYKSGNVIKYTIQLVETPAEYTASTDSTGTVITLSRKSETIQVTGKLNWMDNTELHYVYNSIGDLIRTYAQIARTDVYLQLTADGVAIGEAIHVPASSYTTDSGLFGYASYNWPGLMKYRDAGTEIDYKFQVYSSGLDELLADGHSLTYDFSTKNKPTASVTHDLFDVRGTVHYLYNTSDEFLLKNAAVTAYLYNETTKSYDSVGSAVTNDAGQFEILNLPQGLLTIRATYQDKNLAYAGSVGLKLDRHDGTANLTVDRDAGADSDLYRYTASGTAYYQTDITDVSTRKTVPTDSIVLLYRTVNGQTNAQYVGMTATDANGKYSFKNLESANYLVNVVFSYDGGTYTYDNADVVKDGLSFVIAGSAMTWPDIVKQVGSQVDPGEPIPPDPDEPTPPVEEPKPCITSGQVFFSDNGVHTTDPVENVDVYLYAAANHASLGHVVTDATGSWTKDALGIGDYIAVFSYQGSASRVLMFSVTESDFAAGTLTVQTQYFDRTVADPTGVIKGVVLGETGNKISAMVQVLDMNGNLIDFMYTNKAGMYDFTVPAGFGYQVKILDVNSREETFQAGDPNDDYTALDYYQISGNFSINGVAQNASTIAVYLRDSAGEYNLLTATMTDQQGNYSVKLQDAGNYQVVSYRNGAVYTKHNVSVGYQEWEPVVTESNGKYVISGSESFDSLTLHDRTTDVVRLVTEQPAGTGYSIGNLPAGNYDLRLVVNGQEKHYYLDAPDTEIAVTYFVTVSGTVKDENGKAALGAIVSVYDKATGKAVGNDTVIIDGSYSYPNLPEGSYEIKIKYPVDGAILADKTTADADSYGKSYPAGMTDGSVWSWNINATTVSGTIKDQDGRPIAGAVAVLQDVNDSSRAYAAITDANGDWVAGVLTGTYKVDAMFEYDMTHVYHATSTKTVPVTTDVADVNLVIARYKLTGTVVRDVDSAVIANANITVKYADSTSLWTGVTDEHGRFETLVYPGDYMITAKQDKTDGSQFAIIKADADITIKLGTAMVLSGIVYDVDGVTPVTDGLVHYTGTKSGVVSTDETGKYVISLIASDAGNYVIYAEAAGNKSASETVNVVTDTTKNLTLIQGAAENDKVISGIVTDNDGHRLSNAIVTLVYGSDKTKTLTTSTNESGAYRFQTPDGTYYLTAVYNSPTGYSYSTNAETTVHVNGSNQTANLTVMLSYAVDITVVDELGVIANAEVKFDGASSGVVTTDAAGQAQVRLAGGNYGFQAFVGNRESAVKHIVINKAASITLEIGVAGLKDEPPVATGSDITIDGYVLGPDGNPVENAIVNLKLFDKTAETWSVMDTVMSASNGYYKFSNLADARYAISITYDLSTTATANATTFNVTGYALDDGSNPYVDATVNLYDPDGNLVESVMTIETGYYEFTGLATGGTYKVEIIPTSESGSVAQNLDIEAVPSNSNISGVVLDVNGTPVTGAVVNVANADGNWSMTTEVDGKYEIDLPASGEYVVTTSYPYEQVVDTETYVKDANDANAPEMYEDSFTIAGYVHDTDDNILTGVPVELWQDGTKLADTTTDIAGHYVFTDLQPGTYLVIVTWGIHVKEYEVITGSGSGGGDTDPDEPTPPVTDKIHVSGTVITNHRMILAGANIIVTNLADNSITTLTSDANGMFATGELAQGRYEIYAEYAHKYGTNQSDKLVFTRTQEDTALVIILSYQTDINGKEETVYAGEDDKFDTPDDFYEADVGNDGIKDPVYAGDDGIPGTKDDYYPWDVDKDGEDEKVYVGEDKTPGTPDDWYPVDIDKDGKDETIFIGPDCIPGTEDDWYWKDVDGDGDDEHVNVGPDTKPGTDDDWYEDDNGEKQPVGVWVRFNANGGTVNGNAVWSVKVKEFQSMPNASRAEYDFNGWYNAASGGTRVLASDIQNATASMTVYAQWTAKSSGGGSTDPGGGGGGGGTGGGGTGGGGSGGGGGGGGGGGTVPVVPVIPGTGFVITFDTADGTKIPSQQVKSGDTVIKPSDPVRNGYKFIEWQVGGKAFDFKTPVTSELTLVAAWKHVGVFGLLTDEHIAYIAGFNDGMVHPEANITRAEVAMIFYRLLNENTRAQFKTGESKFTDIASGAWYTIAVSTLTRMEILNGRGNDKFDPSANITRAEFAVIAARFDSEKLDTKLTFQDVPVSHWAHDAILQAAAKGWVMGYGDGNFGPDDFITRAEVMALVNRVLNRDSITVSGMLDGMTMWPDNSPAAWYYEAVQEATNAHKADIKDDVEIWSVLEDAKVGNQ